MNALVLIWMVLAGAGFLCVGYLFGNRKAVYWRIKWVEAEYDLARAQGRTPRSISDIENAEHENEHQPIQPPTPKDYERGITISRSAIEGQE